MSTKQSTEPQDEQEVPTAPIEPEPVQTSEEGIDYKMLYQRALAEQENTRKRLDEEKRQFARFALEDMLQELLPVVDNFYRATEHIPAEQQQSPWVVGLMYIQKQLVDVLTQRGVEEIITKAGDAFDPHMHEAIGTAVDEQIEEDHIIEVKNKGYKLHERILRPVQVMVSKR